jgi:hypothetical protein
MNTDVMCWVVELDLHTFLFVGLKIHSLASLFEITCDYQWKSVSCHSLQGLYGVIPNKIQEKYNKYIKKLDCAQSVQSIQEDRL